MGKLFVDLISAWFKQTVKNIKLLAVICLLAIPVSILINFQLLQKSYLNVDFANLSQISPIYNISIKTANKIEAINSYVAEDITSQWHYKISFERSLSMLTQFSHTNLATDKRVRKISFFSGGYQTLTLTPALGDFTQMNFPKAGRKLVAAITYQEWQTTFLGKKNIIGKQIVVNNKAVVIVAVMPKNFTSFRKNQTVQLVMPYDQLPEILNNLSYSATPDTFSYILAENINSEKLAQKISQYMHDEVLLLGDTIIIINKAIGISTQEYTLVTKRLTLLNLLFSLLLLFCFVAFITFYTGECSQKQQEYLIRSLCGANKQQLIIQRLLDMLLTVVFLLVLCIFFIPLTNYIVTLFFPLIEGRDLSWRFSELIPLLLQFLLLVFLLMTIVFFMQEKLIKTTSGRGSSLSVSQKVQSYVLLSFMLYLTGMAIYSSILLIQSQQKLLNTHLGFNVTHRYLVSFDFPQIAQKKYHAGDAAQLLLKQLEQHSDIKQAALTNMPPLWQRASFSRWYTSDGVSIGTGIQSNTLSDTVSPNYFSTLGTKLVKGSNLTWQNFSQIIVNETLWQRFFSNKELLEAKLLSVNTVNGSKTAYQIVGVVEDILIKGADSAAEPTVYSVSKTLTGFESIIIESEQTKIALAQIILPIIQQQNIAFYGIEIDSLTELADKNNAPRVALLMVSLVASVIIFFAAIVFCYALVIQLANKNARELAVRYSMGAKLYDLVKAESVFFMLIFISLSIPCFYLYGSKSDVLLSYLVATPLINFPIILGVFVGISFIIIILLTYQFQRKITDAWHYLS